MSIQDSILGFTILFFLIVLLMMVSTIESEEYK